MYSVQTNRFSKFLLEMISQLHFITEQHGHMSLTRIQTSIQINYLLSAINIPKRSISWNTVCVKLIIMYSCAELKVVLETAVYTFIVLIFFEIETVLC